ncbi:MAG: sugar transferase [Blastocatellia bacterium]
MNSIKAQKSSLPRPIECVLAFCLLTGLSPVLIVSSLLVRMSSPGPILFCQRRVGRFGEEFLMFKFRTMYVTTGGAYVTSACDNRITPIGRFLRKWKLDELPELFNILVGDMSFVGPRPEVPELVDLTNPDWQRVLLSRPGVTDPITLILRNEEDVLATVEDKEAFYLEIVQPFKLKGYKKYLETKSFRTDLGIVLQTLRAILLPRTSPKVSDQLQLRAID